MRSNKSKRQKLSSIKNRKTFLETQQYGKKWVSKSLILQADYNNQDYSRLGFTVSKRVSKSAVIRNRIKRKLRSVAQDVIGMHAKSGVDYILVGRIHTKDISYEELHKDLLWCLKRMDLLEAK